MSPLMVDTLSIRDVPIDGRYSEYTLCHQVGTLMVGTLSIRYATIDGRHSEYTGCPH